MRLTCPNCDARYEIDDGVIPATGRDVQCSNCGHAWFHYPEGAPPPDQPDTSPPSQEAASAPTDPQDQALQEAGARPRPRKAMDPSVLEVLREEAEFETRARQAEAGSVETQTDLGLSPNRAQRSAASSSGLAEPTPEPDNPGGDTTRRRVRLPDIEEIDTSLRTSPAPRGLLGEQPDLPATTAQKRRGFRIGFSLVLIVATTALVVYGQAAMLTELMPAAGPYLEAYVTGINDSRIWLDEMVRRSVAAMTDLMNG